MAESPLHTINIAIPSENIRKIEVIYDAISAKYENKYPFQNDWTPHIDVLTARVRSEDSVEYIRIFNSLDLAQFKNSILLVKLSLSEDKKYIFIYPDEQSQKHIYKLRTYLMSFLGKYKDLNLAEYFKVRWETYTKEQQDFILKTGSLHEYKPHLSIIKLKPEDAELALKVAQEHFQPFELPINLYMNKETFVETKMFETVATKPLE